LSKVSDCAYLYDWLDLSDREGEAEAFFSQIQKAVETFHGAPATHRELVLKAMAVDSSWNSSAKQYLEIYRYGLLHRQWLRDRDNLNGSIEEYGQKLLERQPLFSKLFHADSSKPSDQHLMGVLSKLSEE
jgi:hypothetical protein